MDTNWVGPAGGANGHTTGRGLITEGVDGRLDAPDNIILTVAAARTYYNNAVAGATDRNILLAAIEGLIAGNPPYDPDVLAAAGLSHMANVNTLDAKALFERTSNTFHNLVNQTENFVVFEIEALDEVGQDHDYSGWAQALAQNWTKAVKKKWRGFKKQLNIMFGQYVKFGLGPIVWSDERDCRWKAVEVNKFYAPDKCSVDPDEWDYICFETTFTVQRLYQIYQEAVKPDSDIGKTWNASALKELLLRKANANNKNQQTQFQDVVDIQKAIQNKTFNVANSFSDSVKLISLLYREYSNKISHYIFEPWGGSEEFLCTISEQYDSFEEAVVVPTYSPGEKEIHSNRGMGHKIFPICQIMMQVDNNMVDMAKMSATPIIKTNPTAGRSMDPIRFISGTATDIGTAEFEQNNLGANIPGLVQVGNYFTQKVTRNAVFGGDDPGTRDVDSGSKSSLEVQVQSVKEFGPGKQIVSHCYDDLDVVVEQMTIKMLHAKEGYPCYDIVKYWKQLNEKSGIPEQIYSVPAGTPRNQMPEHLSVRCARVAGDGSNLGLIVGLNGVAGIAGGFGQKGQYNYRKDIITSRLGADYVDRYLSDSAEPDESGSGATVAQLENLFMQIGKMPQATKDNNHKVHLGSHFAAINQVIEMVRAKRIDPITADQQMSMFIPHSQDHIEFISQDPINQAFVERITPIWRQINKFAQLNRVQAQRMQQVELQRRADEEEKMTAAMMEQARKDKIAEREEARKDFQAEKKDARAQQQSDLKGDIMREKVIRDSENERLEIELRAGNERTKVAPKGQQVLSDLSSEDIQNNLASQVGRTPNPADFE